MHSSALGPSLRHRLAAFARPGWAGTTLARRILAAGLAIMGVVLLIRGDPDDDRSHVLVAATDLPPGRVLTPADLAIIDIANGSQPDGALRALDDATGRTLIGATRRGEPITDVRVISPRAAEAAAGVPDARIVPVQLADAGIADLLHDGDRVDVVRAADPRDVGPGTTEAGRIPTVLAADAAVVQVAEPTTRRSQERVVMLALGVDAATAVAGASLTSALTVVLR